jgi:hypothetical protein
MFAQMNSWTNKVSGNWEDFYWSLGISPGTNQSILFTNKGRKSLTIGTNTALNFPQTLNVGSITLSSPTNSFNTLRLDSSGLETPLEVGGTNDDGSLVIGENSSVIMVSSALKVHNYSLNNTMTELRGDFSIGGTFFETDGSQVTAHFVRVGGDQTRGYYNLINSTLSTTVESVGPGTFNQQGGTNNALTLLLNTSGEYDMFDGYLGSEIELHGGDFNQWGGDVQGMTLSFDHGNYHLAGGILDTWIERIPKSYKSYVPTTDGSFLQTGGTNYVDFLQLGSEQSGAGSYSLSNGVLSTARIDISYFLWISNYRVPSRNQAFGSTFEQSGGRCAPGAIYFHPAHNEYPTYTNVPVVTRSSYTLTGGILSTPLIAVDTGVFTQSGGTNEVGNISLTNMSSSYYMEGGWLTVGSIKLYALSIGTYPTMFGQYGGTNQMSGSLSIGFNSRYELVKGRLTTPNINVTAGGTFSHLGGVLDLPGTLTLAVGSWDEQTAGQQFGPLQLGAGTSILSLPTNSCILRFADSSNLAWTNAAALMIQNWRGSLHGGGKQRILFGTSAAALTALQLTQIQFQDPAGLTPGNYPATILATGEIVPDTRPPQPLKMDIACAPTNGAMQLSISGPIGNNYTLEISTDLVHWTGLTNGFDSNGTIFISDNSTTNYPHRFYRARLVP